MPKTSPSFSRRTLILAGAALPLAGCEMPYGLNLDAVKTSLAVSAGLENAPGITLEQASQIPYASLGYRIGGSQEYILVLASTIAGSLLWTAADHRTLVTANGRVTRSAGFEWNLAETSFFQPDPVQTGLQRMSTNVLLVRTLDLRDVNRFGISVQSTFTPIGETKVSILDANLEVIEVHEDCRCNDLDWNFQNIFWVDVNSGFVWRSVQNIHPNLGALTIEVLRPPA